MLSIVIPTYNQRERLLVTLLALSEQCANNDVSVILVNDGSTDGTKEALDHLDYNWLSIIHQSNMGRSMARNNGIKHVFSKYVLFLDDDMVVTSNFVKEHLAAQQKQEGIYIGEIYNIPPERIESFVKKQEEGTHSQELKDLERVDVLVNLGRYFYQCNELQSQVSWVCMVASNVSFPLELFKQVNGFDKHFKGWGVEDHELAFRFHQVGAMFYFLSNARAFHLDHRKPINRTQLLENVLYFYKKNAPNVEVKGYVDFVTSKISMATLYKIVMKSEPGIGIEKIFFRPNSHLLNKGDNSNGD